MRKLLYLSVIAICGGVMPSLFGCSGRNDNKRGADARVLYEKSLRLIKIYSDSLAVAKDSASVERLFKAYDDAVTRLNFDYPADTGLEISEGENDTLTNLTLRFVELRDSLLYRFAHPLVIAPDSLAGDTTSISHLEQSNSSLKE